MAQSRAPAGPARLGYRPALDGVRALAVVAVFAYHAGLDWARAGFLGVDVFFVLSGYLITALLLTERRREGRVDLLRFWARRARRLLPAVLVLLAAMAVAVPLLAPEQAYRLRGDLGAALGYVSNWRLIFEDQSYFQATGRPPVLQHLWSLAVEEQFYLLWPPVLALAMRHRPYRRLTRPLLVAAAISTVLMAVLFVPWSDPSRVYYGTDTRAAALLIGAALACATTRWQVVGSLRAASRAVVDVAGLLGLAGLAWAVSHVNEFDPRLYRGGFLAVALLAGGLVATAARPGRPGPLGRALGARPLVWLGMRSYGVYLWFWPVLMFTRPHYDVPLTGLPLLALRAGLTLTIAALSYRLVERPIREGALRRVWDDVRRPRRAHDPVRRTTARWGLAISATLACTAVGVAAGAVVRTPPTRVLTTSAGLDAAEASRVEAAIGGPRRTPISLPTPTLPATTTTVALPSMTAPPGPDATTSTTVAPTTTPSIEPPPTTIAVPSQLPMIQAKVTAVGDSVLLGAKPLLESQVDGIVVDATVGRQFPAVLSTVRAYKDGGRLGDEVILQTGNNGPIAPSQLEQLLDLLSDVKKVLVVNVKVDRAWQDVNNDVLASAVGKSSNAVLIDWHAIASSHPEAFYDDGLHLTPTGIRLFASAVLGAL